MSITSFLQGQTFDPESTHAMGVAFDRACQSLRLADKNDPVTKIVARKIIEAAAAGERDPDRLYGAYEQWVRGAPSMAARAAR